MKKKLIFALLCLCVVLTGVYAEHPDNSLGLGLVFRGSGGDLFSGGVGASVKFPVLPIFWSFFANIHSAGVGLGATGDVYIFDLNLIRNSGFTLDWYLGLGAYGNLEFWDGLGFAAGGRLPVGLAWHINKNWEIFLGAAANLGLRVLPSISFPHFFINADLGFRYWF